MTNLTMSSRVNSALNLTSALMDFMALLICLIFLLMVVYHLIRMKFSRGKKTIDVSLILSMNILCIILIKSALQSIHVTIPTLMKDFQMKTQLEDTLPCRLRAYILWSMIAVLYWNYALLAFFRFVRVIYPKILWLHRLSLYLYVLIPAQLVFVFLSMVPLLFGFDGIHLLANEAYCSILIQPFYLFLYSSIISFGIPYSLICIFYIKIGQKLQQSSVIQPYRERNQRDYIVMRRMLLNTIILCIVVVPYLIVYIIDLTRKTFDSFIYRVQWLSSSLSSCIFSLILPLITTQLRNLLIPNRLAPAKTRP